MSEKIDFLAKSLRCEVIRVQTQPWTRMAPPLSCRHLSLRVRSTHAAPRGEVKNLPRVIKKNGIAIGNKLNHPAEHWDAVKHPVWRFPRSWASWFTIWSRRCANRGCFWRTDAEHILAVYAKGLEPGRRRRLRKETFLFSFHFRD